MNGSFSRLTGSRRRVVCAFALAIAFLFPVLSTTLCAQDAGRLAVIERAKGIVDTLSAPYFGGRGYDDQADSLAARYIEEQFEEAGLEPLFDGYQQSFPLQANVFEGEPMLAINGVPLRPGLDMLPLPNSPTDTLIDVRTVVNLQNDFFLPAGENLLPSQYAAPPIDDTRHLYEGAVVYLEDAIPDSLRNDGTIPQELFSRPIRTEIVALMGARAVLFLADAPLAYGGGPVPLSIPAFLVDTGSWPERPYRVDLAVNTRRKVHVTSTNVGAFQRGALHPDRLILVTGHYDHLGRLGPDVFFPGANDNASGIALLIELARYFRDHPPAYSIAYVAFSGEEQGLIGSRFFVEHAPIPLDEIAFLINLDMVASGEQGLVAVGGSDYVPEFELLAALNDSLQLGPLSRRSNAPNSDHYFFLERGVPGFFLYTNKGTQPYHHVRDVPQTLDWDEFEDTYLLTRAFLQALMRR